MTHVTPACAKATSRYPEGRTGTAAGYRAHSRQKETPCAPCREAELTRSRARIEAIRVQGVPEGVLICAQPTRKYPQGRTGTAAGYLAHVVRDDAPCPPCRVGHTEAAQERYLSDRQRFNDQHRLWKYGITAERHAELLEAQGGGCGICGTTEPGGRGSFHVDHDHACCPGIRSCGTCIRGLLCAACNTALGGFKDDPKRLLAAVAYLTTREGAKPDVVH